MCLRYYYLHTSERSYSKGYGTESVLGGPHWLLLGYTRCLGSAAGEVGAASWAWGAAGSQSLRGLLVPRMRWGGHERHLAWERGAGWKCHWNHRREEGERPEGGRWVIAPTCR